jgi:hypothetical protein
MHVLTEPEWRERAAAHEARVDAATSAHLARRQDHRKHPVEDFLFTYYSFKPAELRRWHPGVGVGLEGSTAPHREWRFYATTGDVAAVDVGGFVAARGDTLRFVRDLLAKTVERQGRFGCFGLHEWAMVYRLDQSDVRHSDWPLRLGQAGTDAVVESHQIACSHFDAYRFFTPDAAPRNALSPTRASRAAYEQPGCLHAGMDLYGRVAGKLMPAIPSELVMDCFEFAAELRQIDMRASPYDLTALGLEPIRIEMTEGKAEYVRLQRIYAERGQVLRERLLAAMDLILLNSPDRPE